MTEKQQQDRVKVNEYLLTVMSGTDTYVTNRIINIYKHLLGESENSLLTELSKKFKIESETLKSLIQTNEVDGFGELVTRLEVDDMGFIEPEIETLYEEYDNAHNGSNKIIIYI